MHAEQLPALFNGTPNLARHSRSNYLLAVAAARYRACAAKKLISRISVALSGSEIRKFESLLCTGVGVLHERQTSGLNNSMIRCASITVWRAGYCGFLAETVQSVVTVGVLTADEQRQFGRSAERAAGRVRADPQQITGVRNIHSWVEGIET